MACCGWHAADGGAAAEGGVDREGTKDTVVRASSGVQEEVTKSDFYAMVSDVEIHLRRHCYNVFWHNEGLGVRWRSS